MTRSREEVMRSWARLVPKLLPFADAASEALPLGRLLRLALFQVSVGVALVLLNGTLNRVMIIELGIPAALVAAVVSLPLVFAPLRALIGHRSDHHRSELGWRRVPYIWMGTLLQFGGLAIMPFALLVLAEPSANAPAYAGEVGAAAAFLLVGIGLHMTQTAGLALATDLASPEARPRVVALFYVMLLAGMVGSALVFGWLLESFDNVRLIQVIQGSAAVTIVLNMIALWKQEARRPELTREPEAHASFTEAWTDFVSGGRAGRLLVAVGLGTAGFSMQDILLEPYGGEVLSLSVAATTALTALLAGGTLVGFAGAAKALSRGWDANLLAALGALVGVFSFSLVIFAEPLGSALLFRCGTFGIGLGGGLFGVGTLTAAMGLSESGMSGLALGAWGAVQATAAGGGIALGGLLRDTISGLAVRGALGPGLTGPGAGYSVVYHLEIALLFATLVAIGPLVRHFGGDRSRAPSRFGLAEIPG